MTENCADDFATIWAGTEELRREREGAQTAERDLQRDAPTHRARAARWQPSEWTQEGGSANPAQRRGWRIAAMKGARGQRRVRAGRDGAWT